MLTRLRWIVAVAVLIGCSPPDDQTPQSANPDTGERSLPAGPLAITGSSAAGVTLCTPLTRVDSVYPTARDTVAFGEDPESGWPSKVVTLAPGQNILFESSWIDTLHVWRISSTSPRLQTRGGLRVGSTIADVLATGDSLQFEYPEGMLAIILTRDSVAFQVDDSAAAAFWRVFDYTGDPLRVLSRQARIKILGTGADCRSHRAAA